MKNILALNLGSGTITFIVIAVIVVFLVLFVISIYNKLVVLRENVRNAMSQIATQIESRWDVITNLIGATSKYSEHEANTLREVIGMRTGVNRNSSASEVIKDDQLFQQAMDRINVVVESYPNLKADSLYINTMNNIDKYENNVRNARMIFNDTVTKYNREILMFPKNIFAGIFGFHQEEYFKHSESKANMPQW
ncbi:MULTISPECIES: LemA family protein [Helcococcus]|uniref:LemA family protein n=1 Tax=Helcococcus bovis TaxID=3153252 RepID=A0ABW9F6D9_9FIRM